MRVGDTYVWHRNTDFELIMFVLKSTSPDHPEHCTVYVLSAREELSYAIGTIIQIYKRDLLPEELL